jgi:hypothetical protein
VFYFPAVLLLILNISSSVNWGVPHGLHKIAPVSLSLTASIYRAHKLAYVPSLLCTSILLVKKAGKRLNLTKVTRSYLGTLNLTLLQRHCASDVGNQCMFKFLK